MNLYIFRHRGSYQDGTLIVSAEQFDDIPEIIRNYYLGVGYIEKRSYGAAGYRDTWENDDCGHLMEGDMIDRGDGVLVHRDVKPLYRRGEIGSEFGYIELEHVIDDIPDLPSGFISASYHEG